MEIYPTPEQEISIQQAIESGRIRRPEDAARQGLALWDENERRRTEILTSVAEAEASIKQGKGLLVTSEEQMIDLIEDTKRRGMTIWSSSCASSMLPAIS